jgi:xylulokinase
MTSMVLALDLGTGGCKSSLWSADGTCHAESVVDYGTAHPQPGWNEQKPEEWWNAVVRSIGQLTAEAGPLRIEGIAISGHSLGAVLLDRANKPILDTTPIWSDARATKEAGDYFQWIDESAWYEATGNGFTPELYPVFKAMWFRDNLPDAWKSTTSVVGSKDYINLRLTGIVATDHSYASGSGVYNLEKRAYDDDLLAGAGLSATLFPQILESTDRVGTLLPAAAGELGLTAGIPVFSGGVDNSCMALGSRGIDEGSMYASLGLSSWINLISHRPVIDTEARPFVFAHVIPGMYVSALSTFSTGTTITWLRDLISPGTPMVDFVSEACTAPLGANGLLFLPMLAGGTPMEGGSGVRGRILNLDLSHSRADLGRSAMEGIALCLRRSLQRLRDLGYDSDELLISGGGGRHPGWNQIYADAFGVPLVRTSVGQQAAALGAASCAFVGSGVWDSFAESLRAHRIESTFRPVAANAHRYDEAWNRFNDACLNLVQSNL